MCLIETFFGEKDLSVYLLGNIREHLVLPDKYTDDIIQWNLPFLFAQDDHSAISWAYLIEKRFDIDIPDDEVDIFFFSSIDHMIKVIRKYSSGSFKEN